FGGSLYAGRRVAQVLAEKVVKMDHREGLLANLTTAMLVGVGANLGLPMSTTHVSTGAIAGIAGSDTGRLNRRTVRDLVLAWTVTPFVAGIISVATYLLAARLT
ncbi:MAG: inorganic phosphate transporter, partial [Acidobacteria bacterium]|nr:inorganic phosphate transporter [Acidobacteriota bacterium]